MHGMVPGSWPQDHNDSNDAVPPKRFVYHST
jgi:hypothetical protein